MSDGDYFLSLSLNKEVIAEGIETNAQANLILLVAELSDASTMPRLKELKSLEAVKEIPLIAVSKQHNENQLKMAYRLGAASVIKHPTHFDSMVKILQVMDEYWFNTVKLPTIRR